MPLSKQSIRDDLTAAMKARDTALTGTLRMLLAAVGNAEVAGKEHVELSADKIVALVRAETKKRNESATIYEDAGRAELAAQERAEAAILARYLPAEMSDDDLGTIIRDAVATAAAAGQAGPSAMGTVMKAVREKVGSGADGARVSAAVKAALAG